jgi:exodeoxyribonuclease VIII
MKYSKGYTKKTRLSYSSLKHFYSSPIDFIKYINQDYKWTDSMVLGSAVDCKLLEPEKFNDKFIIVPKIDKRTKQGKEDYKNLQERLKDSDLISISEELNDQAELMVNNLKTNQFSKMILDNTTEVQKNISFNFKGYNIKGILDGFGELNNKPFIFDLKTSQDSDPERWNLNVIKWLYHLQAYIYRHGIIKEKQIIPDFYHVIIENKAPYKVSVVKFSNDILNSGKKIFNKIMEDFDYCVKNKSWDQGHEFNHVNIKEINFPDWYLNKIKNN